MKAAKDKTQHVVKTLTLNFCQTKMCIRDRYLGVHYPTDVLTGFVIALVGSMLSVWIVRTKPEDKQVH